MEKQSSVGHCPCCQAPLPPPQDECQIICSRCGAQIILKLPIDRRIEKIAFARALATGSMFDSAFGRFAVLLLMDFFYGWPTWRFWLRDSGYLDNPMVVYGIYTGVIAFNVLYLIAMGHAFRKDKSCAADCNQSLDRLRFLVKTQPTRGRKRLLHCVEQEIAKINSQLDL